LNYLADTHCHLYFPELKRVLKSIIARSESKNVQKILVPSIDLVTMQDSFEISRQFPGIVYPAAGIHPNYAGYANPKEIGIIRSYLEDHQFTAIGEIGLDFYRNYCPRSVQIKFFRQMLALAAEFNLPVCVHTRNAEDEVIRIMDDWLNGLRESNSNLVTRPGVFHAYEGSEKVALWAKEHNYLLGIGGLITHKKSKKLQDIIKHIDLDMLILETDSPFLAPVPHRGKTNEPAYVEIMAKKIAYLKEMELDRVIAETCENANRLFQWDLN